MSKDEFINFLNSPGSSIPMPDYIDNAVGKDLSKDIKVKELENKVLWLEDQIIKSYMSKGYSVEFSRALMNERYRRYEARNANVRHGGIFK